MYQYNNAKTLAKMNVWQMWSGEEEELMHGMRR